MVTSNQSRLLLIYVATSAGLVAAITLLQYCKYDLLGTGLLLGWDSPINVWIARDIITNGPQYVAHFGNYPLFYIQLLALLGYIAGNVILIERILPIAFSTLLIYANAKITHKITKNIHTAGLAAVLTAISINTLRLYSDLNRNLMVLALSFTTFILIANFIDEKPIGKKTLLDKTYLSIMALYFVIAGTQIETFVVLALTTILLGILTRNWKKLIALTLIPAIPTVTILTISPKLPLGYLNQLGTLTRQLTLNEILLWAGGSWILFTFLITGTAYITYKTLRQKNTLASAILSWTAIITLLVILTTQEIIPLPTEYVIRALFILPIPILFATAVYASGRLLKNTFIEIAMTSPTKRHALKINLKHITLAATTVLLVTSSITITAQHYDEFLIPYITTPSYEKIQAAAQYLNAKGYTKPIVIFYGENANWYTNLYSSYLGAEIGTHYYYKGDINNLLHFPNSQTQDNQKIAFAYPILLITPYLYDKEIPYYITRYHIGQGIYIIPPSSSIAYETDYGPTITITTDNSIKEVRSEYLYADQDDPSTIILRVATKGHTTYTFENYPQNWAFLKLEQGGALSYPETDPRRFDGAKAMEGNDPAESTQNWTTSQTATINTENSPAKEGQANLRITGTTDLWGNLGARYNPQGTWDLSSQFSLAVWAKANENAPLSITLTDSAGNTRTYWDIKPDDTSATAQWKRFVVNLNAYTSQNGDFDLSKVDSIDFYVYSNPGRKMTLCIDDPIIDSALPTEQTVYKARVSDKDLIVAYFAVRIN
jgi:hypothetical protein